MSTMKITKDATPDIKATILGKMDDMKFLVCLGDSCKSKAWKNDNVTWAKLIKKISSTIRTEETAHDYALMSHDEKSKIKDVGGIVCGELCYDVNSANKKMAGRRTKENIKSRSIITLDADECPEGFNPITAIRQQLPGIEAIAYTTHSHTPEHPRWRVFIPLSEWATPFYYEAMARKMGEMIGMKYLDKTTFQYSRMMYWPSTSIDGEFKYDRVEGMPVSQRKFFEVYPALKKESRWPRHPGEEARPRINPSREREGVYNNVSKPEDSIGKPGIIGAFCKAYPIEEAINTFLDDVYKPAGFGRYTYIDGSTAKGLVVLDNLAFSHHSTDPAGDGHWQNSFDLVRIHKFGKYDLNVQGGNRGNTLPSFRKMCDFAANDKKVRGLLNAELAEGIMRDFKEIAGEDMPDIPMPDFSGLIRNDDGQIVNCNENQDIIMLNDPILRRIKYNEFTDKDEIDDPKLLNARSKIIDMGAKRNIATIIENRYGIKLSVQKIREALAGVAARHSYNPVKDYILRVPWDGVHRVDTLLIDFMGAEDSQLVRAQTRKWLMGAVKRVFEPGCKFDYMLVLSGPQGIGKSTLFRLLADDGRFFNENLTFDMDTKTQVETLNSGWIFEVAEMAGMKSVKEQEKVKSFLSEQGAHVRKAYADETMYYPRHCALAATTNEHGFLSDLNSRKFWVIDVVGDSQLRSKLTPEIVSQVWAEAYQIYQREGDLLYLPAELEEESRQVSKAHNIAYNDPRLGLLLAYLDYRLPENWRSRSREDRQNYIRTYSTTDLKGNLIQRNSICAAEVKNEMEYFLRQYDSKVSSQYIGNLLKATGWVLVDNGNARQIDEIYGKQRNVYFRPGTNGTDEVLEDYDHDHGNPQKPFRKDEDDDL